MAGKAFRQLEAYCHAQVTAETDDDRSNAYRAVLQHLAGARRSGKAALLLMLQGWAMDRRRRAQGVREGRIGLALADTHLAHAGVYEELVCLLRGDLSKQVILCIMEQAEAMAIVGLEAQGIRGPAEAWAYLAICFHTVLNGNRPVALSNEQAAATMRLMMACLIQGRCRLSKRFPYTVEEIMVALEGRERA